MKKIEVTVNMTVSGSLEEVATCLASLAGYDLTVEVAGGGELPEPKAPAPRKAPEDREPRQYPKLGAMDEDRIIPLPKDANVLKVCSRCGKEKLRLVSGQDFCRKCKAGFDPIVSE